MVETANVFFAGDFARDEESHVVEKSREHNLVNSISGSVMLLKIFWNLPTVFRAFHSVSFSSRVWVSCVTLLGAEHEDVEILKF